MDTCDNQDESPENYAQWGKKKSQLQNITNYMNLFNIFKMTNIIEMVRLFCYSFVRCYIGRH